MAVSSCGFQAAITAVCIFVLATSAFATVATTPSSSVSTAASALVAPSTTQSASWDGAVEVPVVMKAMKTCTGNGGGSEGGLLFDCGSPEVSSDVPAYPPELDTMPRHPTGFTDLYCSGTSRTTGSTKDTLQTYIADYCAKQGMRLFDSTFPGDVDTEELGDGNTITLQMDFMFTDANAKAALTRAACYDGFTYPIYKCENDQKPLMRGGHVQATLQGHKVKFWVSVRHTVKSMSIPPPQPSQTGYNETYTLSPSTATTSVAASSMAVVASSTSIVASISSEAAACTDAICALSQRSGPEPTEAVIISSASADGSALQSSSWTTITRHVRRTDSSVSYSNGTITTGSLSATTTCTDALCALKQSITPCSDALCVLNRALFTGTNRVAHTWPNSNVAIFTVLPGSTATTTTVITSLPTPTVTITTEVMQSSAST